MSKPILLAMLHLLGRDLGLAESTPNVQTSEVKTLRRIARAIDLAAREKGLDPFLVTALMYRESTFDPEARSKKGAIGLMQITRGSIPKRSQGLSDADLMEIEANVWLGIRVYVDKLGQAGSVPGALSRYNGQRKERTRFSDQVLAILASIEKFRPVTT